jgi:hypothetical protein
MMKEYLNSEATVSEKIAMGGRKSASQGNKTKEAYKRKAGSSLDEFNAKWNSSSGA